MDVQVVSRDSPPSSHLMFSMTPYLLLAMVVAMEARPTFTYIMDSNEGVCAIVLRIPYGYQQLAPDQTMIISKSSSFHYTDLGEKSICDYLELPARIQCDRQHSVEDLKNISSGLGCERYTFEMAYAIRKPLNISGMACVQGVLPTSGLIQFPWTYHPRVWVLFKELSAAMHLTDTHIAAFHWRLGDQLNTRCRKLTC